MKKSNIVQSVTLIFVISFSCLQIKAQENKTSNPVSEYNLNTPNTNLKPDSTFISSAIYPNLTGYNPLSPYSIYRFSSIALDYDLSQSHRLLQDLYLIPYNRQRNWLGLGSYQTIGATIKWAPLNKLSIEGGGFRNFQYGHILFSRHIAYGYNFCLNYDITNKLQFSIYGQYMITNTRDPFLFVGNDFPKTNVGASLQYKANENTKIGLGVEYQFNQFDRKWESDSKLFIGF